MNTTLHDPSNGVDHSTTPKHRSRLRSITSVLVELLAELRPPHKEATRGR